MEAQLCRCNNCNNIFIDQNSSAIEVQPAFEVPEDKYQPLSYETEDGYSFWACPVCYTDEYLIDIIEQSQIE